MVLSKALFSTNAITTEEKKNADTVKYIHNERIKLLSNFYNTLGTGFIVTGTLGLVIPTVRESSGLGALAIVLLMVLIFGGLALHLAALIVMGFSQ